MGRLRKLLPWLVLVLTVGLTAYFASVRGRRNDSQANGSVTRLAPPADSGPPGPLPSATRPMEGRESNLPRLIESHLAKFRNSSGREESQRILRQLRETLRSAEPGAAARAIAAFLKTGGDVPTQLPFAVGPEGLMDQAPSLRTALLDLLPSFDPVLALELSRAVMDQKTSPDEYALALRNLAWSDLDGDLRNELMDRLNQMIQVKDWLADPSAGFLEAIDAAVFVKSDQSFELVASLVGVADDSGDQGLARAAFIAMDRIVQQDPGLLVRAYDGLAGLSESEGNQRASLMSRLEISEADQRNLLVRYLSDPAVGDAELAYFAKLFPNGNYIHGNWLMSGTASTPNRIERQNSDLQVLSELDRLASLGGGDRMIQAIDQIKSRLKQHVGSSTQE